MPAPGKASEAYNDPEASVVLCSTDDMLFRVQSFVLKASRRVMDYISHVDPRLTVHRARLRDGESAHLGEVSRRIRSAGMSLQRLGDGWLRANNQHEQGVSSHRPISLPKIHSRYQPNLPIRPLCVHPPQPLPHHAFIQYRPTSHSIPSSLALH